MRVCPVCHRGDRTTRLGAHWRTLSPQARAEAPHLAPPALEDERWAAPLGLLTLGCALVVSDAWLGFVGLAGGGFWLVSLRDKVAQAASRRADWHRKRLCRRCHHAFLP
ncbi:hypothetical protein [Streptomyces sp. TP-A0356]|uniref:hypothetical protein n=1 Tax=Streptomyces sp. TP-A0356 TaxID=1359208 RepID=UPI0006E19123|nr:hypothetical protein [Streptomyces sp. TP-A0356]